MLKNYRYVYALVSGQGQDVQLFTDERSLPSTITSGHVRRAKEAPGETIIASDSTRFGYLPIQGK
jgi:hypothetical protein